ncbi:aldo/keto reductase [Streptomyces silvisoli]|uniref:Aldo/keto reductase n=1 Tax=Streptomyces silvisoli TaxID=3034235 RepID=A0ABT5ZKN3_9ACTN|nr:aldo/keto reductase [Streptomyces silvisoli]MDF3290155.1 aldo/keto reductase [Streptomyces silvisoli]
MRPTHPRIIFGLHRSRHERRLLTRALELGIQAIDTSSNYLGFQSHTTLANVAGDLLPRLTVSTKVGYFPGAQHSLAPDHLRTAAEQAASDLGREPDVVFLHNPEHSLIEAARDDLLEAACSTLADACAQGLCDRWGISSWDPRRLVVPAQRGLPRPDVLMARAGLLVSADILDAAERLAERLRPTELWGMSPFGGSTAAAVWDGFDSRIFLREPRTSTPIQAAFRAAYRLPSVGAVAVGTDNPDHLGELTDALNLEVDDNMIHQYRELLRTRSQPA